MSASKYSAEFKEQVVLGVVQKSKSIAEVARSYGLVVQTVGNCSALLTRFLCEAVWEFV